MMAGHMTPDARAVAICAYEHAIRLGTATSAASISCSPGLCGPAGRRRLPVLRAGALIQAGQAVPRGPRLARLNPGRMSGAERMGFSSRTARAAGQSLGNALREAQARHDTQFSTEHLALGLLAVDEGLVPPILSALGVSAPALRAAILNRYRQARKPPWNRITRPWAADSRRSARASGFS